MAIKHETKSVLYTKEPRDAEVAFRGHCRRPPPSAPLCWSPGASPARPWSCSSPHGHQGGAPSTGCPDSLGTLHSHSLSPLRWRGAWLPTHSTSPTETERELFLSRACCLPATISFHPHSSPRTWTLFFPPSRCGTWCLRGSHLAQDAQGFTWARLPVAPAPLGRDQ